jgi:hypothetical protein
MRVRVYFCKEPEADMMFRDEKMSKQALDTVFDLVWEAEFKNVITPGKFWLRFQSDSTPFGLPLKEKRSHATISAGDLIQIGNEFFMVTSTGTRRVSLE